MGSKCCPPLFSCALAPTPHHNTLPTTLPTSCHRQTFLLLRAPSIHARAAALISRDQGPGNQGPGRPCHELTTPGTSMVGVSMPHGS